ncbi:unnamed protein product [Mucor circinelloides]
MASHFYLIENELNSRPRWPPTFPGHSANCSSNLFADYSISFNIRHQNLQNTIGYIRIATSLYASTLVRNLGALNVSLFLLF